LDVDQDGLGNPCDGDFNGDGSTDATDVSIFDLCLGSTTAIGVGPDDDPNCEESDMNGDGVVDDLDDALLRDVFVVGAGDWDGDGILDDGDGTGTAGDNFCHHQQTTGCDDNCRDAANALQVNANAGEDDDPTLSGVQEYGNVCDPDLDNDGDVDGMDRLMQLACFRGQEFPGFDCSHADLVGTSLTTDPDPAQPQVNGLDRLQMLRWFRSPGSTPGQLP